jgi:CPA2 family monovalent cation:H+ antiporter-2
MIHSDLVATIVLAILAAFAGGFIASKLGIPTIVGYLLAGVAIGPYTPGATADISIASDLAEIGVILLMFGVGLHFSVGDLLSVRRIALPGALAQITAATGLGFALSQLWGWDVTEGLIFGLTLSVASTVVLLRALEERGEIESRPGHIAVGWLIVEDLFTVAVLILLPAILGGGDEDKGLAAFVAGDVPALAVTLAFGQAIVFIVLMLVVGRQVIPLVLREVSKTGSREMFTLCVLATALGVAFGASEFFGVSLALGAFLAGIILNESDLSQRAATEALPFRDAFAVIFFVSVGMLFEPSILWESPDRVAAVVAIVVVGKSIAALGIVVSLGYGIRNALVVSAGLAQIGEFSFILAGLAMSLGHFSEEAQSLVLAGSVISITLNPLFFRVLEPLEGNIARLGQNVPLLRPVLQPAAKLAMEDQGSALERHVVVFGYGLVGRELVNALEGRGFKYLVVESDPNRFEALRSDRIPAIYGDAVNPSVLQACRFERARMVAITFPGPTVTKTVLEYVKTHNPRINVVVRGRTPLDYRELIDAGATEVVQAELEAGLEFVSHALRYYGVDRTQIQAFLARRRGVAYDVGG